MAHKPTSFKLRENKADQKKGKKYIIIYTNVNEPAEKSLMEYYLKEGYQPLFDEKKEGTPVTKMKEELSADKEALAQFEKIYAEKNGFHNACKFYQAWKKKNK